MNTPLQAKVRYSANGLFLVVFLVAIIFTAIFATEMYVPSLPAIATYFKTNNHHAKLTITYYLLAMALSQFVYGSLSDRYGRKSILLLGLSINVIGNLICSIAPSITILMLGRFVQGIGVGAPMCLSRSIARDVFSGARFAQVGAYISLSVSIMPAIAPILGGYFQQWFGWRASFIFLLGYAIFILFVSYWVFAETHLQPDQKAMQPQTIIKNYFFLLSNLTFMRYLLCGSVAISGLFIYYMMSPFLFQTKLGLTPVAYGWLAIFTTSAMILGRIINSFMLKFFNFTQIITIGNFGMLLASMSMLAFGCAHIFTIAVVLIPMIIFILASGLVFSNAATGALHPFPQMAGVAAAAFSGLQTAGAFICTAVAAALHEQNQIPMAVLLTALSGLCVAIFSVNRPSKN